MGCMLHKRNTNMLTSASMTSQGIKLHNALYFHLSLTIRQVLNVLNFKIAFLFFLTATDIRYNASVFLTSRENQ